MESGEAKFKMAAGAERSVDFIATKITNVSLLLFVYLKWDFQNSSFHLSYIGDAECSKTGNCYRLQFITVQSKHSSSSMKIFISFSSSMKHKKKTRVH